jgi:hypothetical protein
MTQTVLKLKQPVVRDGRMIAGSGLQAWDAQVGILRPGEEVDRAYHTALVHGREATEEAGDMFPVGYLRSEDLSRVPPLPQEVFDRVLEATETGPLLLTQLRHWRRKKGTEDDVWEPVVHGYIGTRPETQEFVLAKATGPTWLSESVVRFAIPYLATAIPDEWGEARSRKFNQVRWPDEATGELR